MLKSKKSLSFLVGLILIATAMGCNVGRVDAATTTSAAQSTTYWQQFYQNIVSKIASVSLPTAQTNIIKSW